MKTEVSLISWNKTTRKDVGEKEAEREWGMRMMDGRIGLPVGGGDFSDGGNQGTRRVPLRRVLLLSERGGVYRENNEYFNLVCRRCCAEFVGCEERGNRDRYFLLSRWKSRFVGV